jgi:heparan-sulfate lyase
MASRGKSGAPPAKTSIAYPQSGFYFFRSDWKRDAVFLALKCGETAFWHNQPDNGSFELYAYGRNLMTDSGCYLYGSSDPEDQRWRAWFRSTKAHQTLTLDGKDTLCAPTFRCWCETENGTALVVENQSAEKLRHRRTVLFIDRRYVVIHDEALGVAAGDVRVHFQFVPCEAEIDGSIARTKFADGANLQVKTFSQQQELITEKEEGWISYQIRKKQERPAWSWKTTKRASDAAVSFLTVLEPYRQGANAVVDDLRVEVDGDQRRFTWNDDGKKREALLDITAKTFTINP